MVGQTISHYRILQELGGGGMGVVYKATDLRLNRFVALKFLSPALTRDHDANQRFRHEAQSASALDHPNICTIHEIDETPSGDLFLTMAYYAGETLKERIARGPLPTTEALDIALQVATGLARAHQSGLVHRDVKPANLIVTSDGVVKIVDFGLAKLSSQPDVTRTGVVLGTVAYMSPEQARGGILDARTDVWSLGVVLYEMLAGRRPFDGPDDVSVLSKILESTPESLPRIRQDMPVELDRIVSKSLNRDLDSRYRSATELLDDLTACRASMQSVSLAPASAWYGRRGRWAALAAGVIVLAAGIPTALALQHSARERWARNTAIPEIRRLAESADFRGAFALFTEADRYLPGDPTLAALRGQFSTSVNILTDPEGADVFVQPYATDQDHWERLGQTPLKGVRIARGAIRLRIEKTGFETLLLAAKDGSVVFNLGTRLQTSPFKVSMLAAGSAPGMVPVPGGDFAIGLTGFNSDQRVDLDAFLIDRFEVTNSDFKAFVAAGGYTTSKHWDGLGATTAAFVDSTGHPGPSTWELGDYPHDQAAFPVGGVSWYEAAAYCRAAGKTLPTIFHWARAGLSANEIGSALAPAIIPLSNFGGKGVAAVGSYRGLGPYGTYDMAGNAREWTWNEAPDGRRWIPGGAWNDPDYMFTVPNSLPPSDRSATNGFRCASYPNPAAIPAEILARFSTFARDNRTAKAVSNETYEVFKRQYAPVTSPLNVRVDGRDESHPDRIREILSFDSGYDDERVVVYLNLPRDAAPPYQPVIFFPGVGVFSSRASSAAYQFPQLDIITKGGRALVMPVYKGSFERWDPFISLQGEEYLRTFRARMFQWRQDLGRTIDMLSQRKDIDISKVAYYGSSFGASTAFPLVALEERLKVAILGPAGFTYREMPDVADAINYVGHVTIPVLMIGGNHDYIFPLETSQKPMFDRLGTSPDRKRLVTFESGHADFPRSELIREVQAWLDRFLGPVRKGSAP